MANITLTLLADDDSEECFDGMFRFEKQMK